VRVPRASLAKSASVLVCATLGLTGLTALGTSAPAVAAGTAQPTVVNAKPAAYTPNVNNGVVYAIGQTGSTVVLGGSFTSISPHGSTATTTVTDIAAFTAGTGALVSGFAPTLDGTVNTIIAGPTPGTVYVGGAFKTVDGVSTRLALLNAATGAIVAGWTSPKIDGAVNTLVLADGQLFVGGEFDAAGGAARGGLATLNPTTGALTKYSTLSFTGHHNYGVNCSGNGCADGGVGVTSMDVTAAGTRLVAIGNFTSVSGSARDQVAMLDLSATTAVVDPTWNTDGFTSACADNAFDSYVRAVQFSPDGSYFVIADTGAGGTGAKNSDGTRAICDSVSRFETGATGADIQPTWVDWTGNDSFWSVAVTGSAIYLGGHERWLNNSDASDTAGPGSVPRPGVAAVDPQNGLPLAWNPGRAPRGAGAYALLATADGLYVGSDTDYIGPYLYQHDKIAFFPAAGGETLPANTTGSLPGDIYQFGTAANPSGVHALAWDGTSAPTTVAATVTGFSNATVRGAFEVNGTLYYASTDGNFYAAPFAGTNVGTPVAIDPYDDPTWSTVVTGNAGGGTYRGVKSSFYSELGALTSMFYSNGRVYYTLSGQTAMHWRYFETDDGVMGADEFTTTDTNNWSNVAGAFLSGTTLYYSTAAGTLMSIPFTGGEPAGTPTVANTAINWASHGDVLISSSQVAPNQPPVAAFTATCTTTAAPCAIDGSASHDPDGTLVSYAWTWGDGSATQTTTTPTTTHTYATAGTYTVGLTVTDNDGATNTVSHAVTVTSPNAAPISFRAAATYDGNAATGHVTVPAAVQAGDELLLFATDAGGAPTAPTGWTSVGATTASLSTAVFSKTATTTDPGSTVTVTFPAVVKASLTLAAYAGAGNPVETENSATNSSSVTHVSPTVIGLATGSWGLTFWTDKSSTTSAWTAPNTVTTRSSVYGTGGGAVSALLTDSGAPTTGTYGGLTATTNVASGTATSWTIALAPTT
jgi:PKD repeat protein